MSSIPGEGAEIANALCEDVIRVQLCGALECLFTLGRDVVTPD
jgi:hypothetical protein